MCDDDEENPFRMFEHVKPFTREPINEALESENPFSNFKSFLDPTRSNFLNDENPYNHIDYSDHQLDSDCDENWTSMSDSDNESSSDFDSEVDTLSQEICSNLNINKKNIPPASSPKIKEVSQKAKTICPNKPKNKICRLQNTKPTSKDVYCDEDFYRKYSSSDSESDIDSQVDFLLSQELSSKLNINKKNTPLVSSPKIKEVSQKAETICPNKPKNEICRLQNIKPTSKAAYSAEDLQRKAAFNENRSILLPLLFKLNEDLNSMIEKKRFTITNLLDLNELVKPFHKKIFTNCYNEITKLIVIPPEILDKINKEESIDEKRLVIEKIFQEYVKDVELHIHDLQTLILDDKLILKQNGINRQQNFKKSKKLTSAASLYSKRKSMLSLLHKAKYELNSWNEDKSLKSPGSLSNLQCLLKQIKQKKCENRCFDDFRIDVIPSKTMKKINDQTVEDIKISMVTAIIKRYQNNVESDIKKLGALVEEEDEIMQTNQPEKLVENNLNCGIPSTSTRSHSESSSSATSVQSSSWILKKRKFWYDLLYNLHRQVLSWLEKLHEKKAVKVLSVHSNLAGFLASTEDESFKLVKDHSGIYRLVFDAVENVEKLMKNKKDPPPGIENILLPFLINLEPFIDGMECDENKKVVKIEDKSSNNDENERSSSETNKTKTQIPEIVPTPNISETSKAEEKIEIKINESEIEENKSENINEKENHVEKILSEVDYFVDDNQSVQIHPSSTPLIKTKINDNKKNIRYGKTKLELFSNLHRDLAECFISNKTIDDVVSDVRMKGNLGSFPQRLSSLNTRINKIYNELLKVNELSLAVDNAKETMNEISYARNYEKPSIIPRFQNLNLKPIEDLIEKLEEICHLNSIELKYQKTHGENKQNSKKPDENETADEKSEVDDLEKSSSDNDLENQFVSQSSVSAFFKNVECMFEAASKSETQLPVETYKLLLYQQVSTFVKFLSYSKLSNNKRVADVHISSLKDSIIQLITSLLIESQVVNNVEFDLFQLTQRRECFKVIVSSFEKSLKTEILKIEVDKSVMIYLQFEGSLNKFIKSIDENCDKFDKKLIDEYFCLIGLFATTIPKIEYMIFQSLKGVEPVVSLLNKITNALESLLELKIESIAKDDNVSVKMHEILLELKENTQQTLEFWQKKSIVVNSDVETIEQKEEESTKKRKRSRRKSSSVDKSVNLDESGCKTDVSLNKSRSERRNKKGSKGDKKLGEQFTKLLSVEKAMKGVQNGKYVKGFFRVNKKNIHNCYMTSESTNEDILIPGPLARNRALDGDEVVVLITGNSENKDGSKKKNGKIVCILQEVHTRRCVGQIVKFDNDYLQAVPRDNTVPKILLDKNMLPLEFQKDNWEPNDMLYCVEILVWDYTRCALGKLIEAVGPKNSLMAESKANLLELGLHSEPVDPSLEKFLPDFPYEIPEEEIKIRKDLRNEVIFTIDPETAKDLDDALSIKKLPDGFYEVGVHIADPSFFLEEGTELDEVVLCRATSIYLVDQVIHMLPLKLCLLCSLLPGKDRLSVSVIWKMDAKGNVLETNFCRSVMRSCVQLAYAHAQDIIEDKDVELPPIQNNVTREQVKNCVKELYSISKHIRKRRFDGGALRIDQAKMGFKLNKDYEPISKSDEVIRDSNRMIEDFMLLANESVAKFISKHHPKIALLRRHCAPKEDHMNRISKQLKDIGINLKTVSSGEVHSSLEKYSSDGPINRIVMTSICVKMMKRAEYFCYCPKETRHYALNLEYYTHFTSPIRRYPDIMVHRLLTAILGYSELPTWSTSYVRKVASHSNKMKLAAKQAGDMSVDMYRVVYTRNFGPFITKGIVTNVFNNSFDAYIQELATTVKVSTKEIDAEVEYFDHNFASYMSISWNHLPHYQFQLIQLYKVVDLTVKAGDSNMTLEGHLIAPKFKYRF